ncbi:MAG TPA: mechanosensitive ion channel family protein [Bacteriovoracaceae bacterium]|nr:mechanosensitive ion channel family protein [Bacteriovoracaceae bacterium]
MNIDIVSYLNDPRYYIPLGISVGVYLVLWLVKDVLIIRLKRISANTETYIDDVILLALDKTRQFFMIGTAVYSGFQASPFDTKKYGPVADKLFIILLAIQVIIWGMKAISSWFEFALEKKNNDPSVKTTFGFLGLLIKFCFLAGVFLFALSNIGYNVSTFIAGLGVGGIAIALATQNILGDLFSSLSIVVDKPFIVGDYIHLGEWQGHVEHVGLKTTRIRGQGGEQIIVSNSDLLSSKIRNYKRMTERRVIFELGVTYKAGRDKLKLLPSLIEVIVNKQEKTRFERAHFTRYGASSMDFEIVYWVTNPEYLDFADIHQRILLAIHEAFETHDLQFAYPTQTIIIEKEA